MVNVRLLKNGYKKSESFYTDFLEDKIKDNDDYFTEEVYTIEEIPDFPIYMGISNEEERNKEYMKAFDVIEKHCMNLNRNIFFDETFWHSLLCAYKREYLLKKYPQITEKKKHFDNIVVKNFNWENYIYKCILAVQYVTDRTKDEEERKRYYKVIIDNLDLYNYIIKYSIFRNDNFLLNIMDIIDECDLSSILKQKIKGRPDLGKDERYGRRVIFEFNKSYPIVMSPMFEKDELKKKFIEYLGYYYDLSKLEKVL